MSDLLSLLPPVHIFGQDEPFEDESAAFVHAELSRHWTPREKVSPEQWMRERLRLEANQSAEYAGEPLDLRRAPHARLILDFLADPMARELNVMKSSSAQLSTTTIGAFIFRLWDDPCNILYLISNLEEAKKLSKQVWKPFLRQVFNKSVDTEEQANLHFHINGVEVFSGSPTENLMRNKQVGLICEDESDTMNDTLIGGGQDLETAQDERSKNTRESKIIRLCTPLFAYDPKRPNVEQPGTRIHRNFLRGNQMEYRVPCPHCGNENALHEDQLVCDSARLLDGTWDLDLVLDETYWRCPSCAKPVYEGRQKAAMMNAGRWVPTQKGESRAVWSARHTDLVSLIGKVTWGYVKAALLKTKGTPKEAGARRAYLAEPENISKVSAARTHEAILRHCSTYSRGTCPIVPWRVLLTVDVQKNCERMPWMISALPPHSGQPGKLSDIWILDWGEAHDFGELFTRDVHGNYHGLLTQPVPLALSNAVRNRHFGNDTPPENVFISRALIDSGYFARDAILDHSDSKQEGVYSFCAGSFDHNEMRFLFVPVKGRSGAQVRFSLTVDTSVEHQGVTLPLHFYDDPAHKRLIYNECLSEDPKKLAAAERMRIHLPRADDVDETLLIQLCAEREIDVTVKLPNGRPVTRSKWDNPSDPNDLGDCLKWVAVFQNIAARQIMDMQRQQAAA